MCAHECAKCFARDSEVLHNCCARRAHACRVGAQLNLNPCAPLPLHCHRACNGMAMHVNDALLITTNSSACAATPEITPSPAFCWDPGTIAPSPAGWIRQSRETCKHTTFVPQVITSNTHAKHARTLSNAVEGIARRTRQQRRVASRVRLAYTAPRLLRQGSRPACGRRHLCSDANAVRAMQVCVVSGHVPCGGSKHLAR